MLLVEWEGGGRLRLRRQEFHVWEKWGALKISSRLCRHTSPASAGGSIKVTLCTIFSIFYKKHTL